MDFFGRTQNYPTNNPTDSKIEISLNKSDKHD